jgi:hypothetical protein
MRTQKWTDTMDQYVLDCGLLAVVIIQKTRIQIFTAVKTSFHKPVCTLLFFIELSYENIGLAVTIYVTVVVLLPLLHVVDRFCSVEYVSGCILEITFPSHCTHQREMTVGICKHINPST